MMAYTMLEAHHAIWEAAEVCSHAVLRGGKVEELSILRRLYPTANSLIFLSLDRKTFPLSELIGLGPIPKEKEIGILGGPA